MRAIFFVGLLLFSFGCSKSPEPATEPVAAEPVRTDPAPEVKPDNRPVIVALGNSLSAGFGLDPGSSYPDFLQRELDGQGYQYRVVNAGISGDTTSGGVDRLDSVLAHKPAIVILELGGNDGLRGFPVSLTRANLEKMIVALQAGGAKVVLAGITLPPNYGPAYIRDFENNYHELAREHRLPLIPFLLEGVALVPGMMQRDGIHPTAQGNQKVARTVLKVLVPLLTK
ncbi:MAG: arylesterase [Bryobacteraceae bacterium]